MRDQARHCRLASAVATAKSRQRRGAKAGPRKIAEALHAREGKKRWVRVVVKRRMASPRPHRVDALRTETAHRGVVLAVGVATRAAMLAVAGTVQDSATRVQAVRGQQVAHRAAVAATVATRLLVARALAAVAAAVTIATAVVVLATRAVVVATTVAAREVVKAAAMVVATKAVQVQARRARAGVIAVSRRLMAAVVAAPVVAVVVLAAAAPAVTEIAAAAVASQVIVVPRLLAAASALAAAQATVMA